MKNSISAYFKKIFTSKRYYLTLAIFFFLLVIDLLSKYFTNGMNPVVIIPGVLSFVSTKNTGGAWSILNEHSWVLLLLSSLFMVILVVYNHFASNKNTIYTLGYSFVLAGGAGNLIDRVLLGEVRDFIQFDFMNFPVFNFADICVSFGVVFLLIYIIFYSMKKEVKNG